MNTVEVMRDAGEQDYHHLETHNYRSLSNCAAKINLMIKKAEQLLLKMALLYLQVELHQVSHRSEDIFLKMI